MFPSQLDTSKSLTFLVCVSSLRSVCGVHARAQLFSEVKTRPVTFLLQSELPLGLDVLQGCSQVSGQTSCAVGHQEVALLHRG